MQEIAKLGYVGVQSPAYEQWRTWAPEAFGCMLGPDGDDGAVRIKIDDADYRLSIHPGDEHRLAYVGWEVLSHRDLDTLVTRLDKAGANPQVAGRELADSRGVLDLVTFQDCFGQPYEAFCYQASGYKDWDPPRPHQGFVTGDQGLGHVVFVVPDARKAVDWHIDVLGFRPSDIIKLREPLGDMWFLRANPRHHSVAFLEIPELLGLHHVYLECNSLDDVGYSYYDVLGGDQNPDMLMKLGRHIGDQTVSYYIRTPAGFFIEYGWDGLAIPETEARSPRFIDVRKGKRPEMWGHEFTMQPNETVRPYKR
ncbi:VOC family protein [Actinomadura sp. 9N407]|uniref:VOC family protein n=1 Tax=Actinomadura sp. 9N407 TaxID=3375154 RepID=UPI0037A86B21